jgi:lysozyme family protein
MSDFDDAIPTVLRHEGGFENDINDPGGATNYGVSLRWLKAEGLIEGLEEEDKTQDEVMAVKLMTRAEAAAFYKCYWWDVYKYGYIISQPVATKVFDTAVNLGPSRAHRFLQYALGVLQDGVLGPKTFNETNATPSAQLVVKLQNLQASYYRNLVARNIKLAGFLNGWMNRAYDRN